MTKRQQLLREYRATIDAVEKALAANATGGNADVVSVTISTAGNSQSVSKSATAWKAALEYWGRRIADLSSGGSFFRGRIVTDFGDR